MGRPVFIPQTYAVAAGLAVVQIAHTNKKLYLVIVIHVTLTSNTNNRTVVLIYDWECGNSFAALVLPWNGALEFGGKHATPHW